MSEINKDQYFITDEPYYRPVHNEVEMYEAAYAARLNRAYPRRADGKTLFPFRRLFIVALARI